MQSPVLRPIGHHGRGGPPTPVFVGFPAHAHDAPQSPTPWLDTPSQRRRSLLSDLLSDAQAAMAQANALLGGGGDADMFDAAAAHDDVSDDDEDLDEEELGLLEALDAAWGSPSSSIFSTGTAATAASRGSGAGSSAASAASASRPIAIPAATYFKDQAQRAAMEKLNKKRQWYSQQAEQERLVGKTGAKAATMQVPRPPPKQHKQYNGHGGAHK